MSYSERSQAIMELLKTKKKATIEELASQLFVSEATIRRDLNELKRDGVVERTHGGAMFVEETNEMSIFIRRTKNAREKVQAAEIAMRHLPEFQIVFIDNSSTCLALAEKMNFMHKTVITNGLQIALCVAQNDSVKLMIPGGEIASNTTAVTGGMTISALNDFRFDLALLSCSAVDSEGSYELSPETMHIKKVAIERSRQRILIFDNTKIDTRAAFRTAPLSVYDMLVSNASYEETARMKEYAEKIITR